MAGKVSFRSIIKNSGFRYLWINQILVQLAYNTLNFALIVWVFKLLDSSLAVSTLLLAIYLPSMLFGVFAGVFVDIADRRKIIILIDILLATLFLLFILIKRSYPLILLNTFLINSLAQFFMPSESSSIPLLVPRKQLLLANSMFSLTLYGSLMLGYSIGGPLLSTFGLNSVFLLGTGMLLGAFVLAQNLPVIKVSGVKRTAGQLSLSRLKRMIFLTKEETTKTFQFIRGKIQLTTAIGLLTLVQGVIGMSVVMMPSYLERVLRIHATDSSYFVMLPLGLGMISGAFLIGRILHNRPKRSLVIPGIVGAGVLLMVVAVVPTLARLFQSPELPVGIAHPRYFFRVMSLSSFFSLVAFLLGFCAVAVIVPCQTVLQENTTEKNRGKIFSVLGVLMTAFPALPVVLAGIVSDVLGVTPIFLGIGAIVTAVGLLAKSPGIFFGEKHLPFKIREFLGLSHWD